MRYLVIRPTDQEPIVHLWTKEQRPNPKDRDYPHTTYMKNNHIPLETVSSAGYVFYDPDTQQSEVDDNTSYQMDNHEQDRDADFNLVKQALSGFCLTHRDRIPEIRQEWIVRQEFLKHRAEVLKRLNEMRANQ